LNSGFILFMAVLAGLLPSSRGSTPPKDWKWALQALGAQEGEVRRLGQAWLADHLEPEALVLFLEALGRKQDPEVRVRGVAALAGRLDLFPALAGRFLENPSPLVLQALTAQVRKGLPPPPEKPDRFMPLPQASVRMGPLPRTPPQVGGLLSRTLFFPLPLLVWPGFSGRSWAPSLSWGGEVRKLLFPKGDSSWLQGGRVLLRKDCLLLVPPGIHPKGGLESLVPELLRLLGRKGPGAREAALALGQVPFLPMGEFLLQEGGSRQGREALPFLWGLASFAARSGFGPGRGERARSLLVHGLGMLRGEGLAWAAYALAALGPGRDANRGKDLERAWKSLGRRDRWKALLPLLKTPISTLRPFLLGILGKGPATSREAACLVRALALLSAHPPRTQVERALSLAGPGAGAFGARLLAPLPKKEGPWAVKTLFGKDPGRAELAACALGETPEWGWKALVESLSGALDPARLQVLLLGLRTARDRGAPGLGPALMAAWERARGREKLGVAVALGLLLDEGFFLGPGPDRAEGLPVSTWKVKDRFQDVFPGLVRFLSKVGGEKGNPFRFPAARALGRLHGLHQDFQVGGYLSWAGDPEGRKALLLLLREWVQIYPQGGPLLGSTLSRGRWSRLFGGAYLLEVKALLEGSPPPWSSLDLDLEDPLTWALGFEGE